MKTEDKIVKFFIENKVSRTIRESAKEIKSDYRITHTAIQRLIRRNVLLCRTVGKSTLCEINPSYYGIEIYKAENERRESLLKKRNILQLYKEIMEKLKTSLFVLLVFGSYAKGNQTKNSDIDMMLISNEKDFEEKISGILSLIPLKTHALVFTEEDFIRMKDSRKSNVVQEAMANNIILYGIEGYYRCLMTND